MTRLINHLGLTLRKVARELTAMSFVRCALLAVILGAVTSGVALAQLTTPSSSPSSKIDDLSQWTSKQWHRAKAEWEKEKRNGPTAGGSLGIKI